MMRNKIFILFVVFCFQYLSVKSQTCDTIPQMLQQLTASPIKMHYLQYDGTPYIYDDWRIANVALVGGEVFKNQRVKIDLFLEELVYYNSSLSKQLIVDKEIIKQVIFVDDIESAEIGFVNVCEKDSNENIKYAFYFIHLQDSISLWSKQIKKIENYNEATNGNRRIGKYYLRKKHFYVYKEDMMPISISKRMFSKEFPSIRKPLLTFIRKNRYSLKKSKDLIEVFKYINQAQPYKE